MSHMFPSFLKQTFPKRNLALLEGHPTTFCRCMRGLMVKGLGRQTGVTRNPDAAVFDRDRLDGYESLRAAIFPSTEMG